MGNGKKPAVWVIIAAYNEEKKISAVIDSIKKQGYANIVVVDDGSEDRTKEAAETAGAYVLQHIVNRGQGAALKTGIDFALQQGTEVLVTFDADGQHQAEEIKRLIEPIQNGTVDVCLGSRFLENTSNVSWHRAFLLKTGALMMQLLYGIHLTDSHNGFRAFSQTAAQKLSLKADRMEHASEILEEIAKNKLRYREIPVTITYTDYSLEKGQSSFAAFEIVWNMLKNKVLR